MGIELVRLGEVGGRSQRLDARAGYPHAELAQLDVDTIGLPVAKPPPAGLPAFEPTVAGGLDRVRSVVYVARGPDR